MTQGCPIFIVGIIWISLSGQSDQQTIPSSMDVANSENLYLHRSSEEDVTLPNSLEISKEIRDCKNLTGLNGRMPEDDAECLEIYRNMMSTTPEATSEVILNFTDFTNSDFSSTTPGSKPKTRWRAFKSQWMRKRLERRHRQKLPHGSWMRVGGGGYHTDRDHLVQPVTSKNNSKTNVLDVKRETHNSTDKRWGSITIISATNITVPQASLVQNTTVRPVTTQPAKQLAHKSMSKSLLDWDKLTTHSKSWPPVIFALDRLPCRD